MPAASRATSAAEGALMPAVSRTSSLASLPAVRPQDSLDLLSPALSPAVSRRVSLMDPLLAGSKRVSIITPRHAESQAGAPLVPALPALLPLPAESAPVVLLSARDEARREASKNSTDERSPPGGYAAPVLRTPRRRSSSKSPLSARRAPPSPRSSLQPVADRRRSSTGSLFDAMVAMGAGTQFSPVQKARERMMSLKSRRELRLNVRIAQKKMRRKAMLMAKLCAGSPQRSPRRGTAAEATAEAPPEATGRLRALERAAGGAEGGRPLALRVPADSDSDSDSDGHAENFAADPSYGSPSGGAAEPAEGEGASGRGFCIDFLSRARYRGTAATKYLVDRLLGAAQRLGHESAVIIEAVNRERFTTELMTEVAEFDSAHDDARTAYGMLQAHARGIFEQKCAVKRLKHSLTQWVMRESVLESLRANEEEKRRIGGAEDDTELSALCRRGAKLREFWPLYREGAHRLLPRAAPARAAAAPMPRMGTDPRGLPWKTRPARSECAAEGWEPAAGPAPERAHSAPSLGAGLRRQGTGGLALAGPAAAAGAPQPEPGAAEARRRGGGERRPRSQGAIAGPTAAAQDFRLRTTEAFQAGGARASGAPGLRRAGGGRRSEAPRPQRSRRWWQNGPFYLNAGTPGVPPVPADAGGGAGRRPQGLAPTALPDPRAGCPRRRAAALGAERGSPCQEALRPLAEEVFEDPRGAAGSAGASLILADGDVDPPAKRYLRACDDLGIVPLQLPFCTGSSARLQASGTTLKDEDVAAIASMLPDAALEELDLRGNSGLSAAVLQEFLEALGRGAAARALRRVDLSGCTRLGQAGPLGAAVRLLRDARGLGRLQNLDLSGVQLGVRLQLPLCQAICAHGSLCTLGLADTQLGADLGADLGRQCVGELLGCKALRTLDLSWNCFSEEVFSHLGQQLVETQRLRSLSVAGCASACPQRSTEEITPAALLIERLSRVHSLTSLDVSLCRLDHRGALVLEDALGQARSLSELLVAHNPMGALGIRCLVRLLSRATSGLRHFDCEGCNGEATRQHFDSDSQLIFYATHPGGYYPLDLAKPYHRTILRMLCKSSELFGLEPRDCFRELRSTHKYEHAQKDQHGVFQVPSHGRLSFTFTLEKATESALQESVDLSFREFLERHARLTCLALPSSKVVALLAEWRRLHGREQERMAILDAVSKDFLFTPAQLELLCQQPGSDSAEIVGRLLPVVTGGQPGLFLSLLAQSTIDDFSRTIAMARQWLLFNPDNPTGRYRLDLKEPADHAVAGRLVLLDSWEAALARLRGRQDTSQHGNRSQVRNALYDNTLLASRLARPDGPARPIWEWTLPERGTLSLDYTSQRRPPEDAAVLGDAVFESVLHTLQQADPVPPEQRLQALRHCSHHIYVSSLQLRALLDSFQDESLRAETFVILFNRVADMHNEKIFRVRFEGEVGSLRNRLGYATYFPFVQPEQSHARLDFAYHDQRLAAHFLVYLHFRERITNIQKPSYVVDGVQREELKKGIPKTWETFSRMPESGIFTCSYKCAEKHRNFKLRKEFLNRYGGWHASISSADVMWWVSLADAPEPVVHFIEFLNVNFDNIHVPLRDMDCLAQDGSLSVSEFAQGFENIGYHVGGKDRAEAIFSFLDMGEQRELQVADTISLLICAYNEVKMSIREFMKFSNRVVGNDVDGFWLMLTGGDRRRSLSMQEFVEKVKDLGFFGSVHPIFMYLSHLDEAGLLTRSTFRSRLEDFGAATRRDSTAKAVLTGSQELSALSSRESTKDRLAREGAERRKGSKEPAGSKEKAGPREPSGSMEQTGSKERARLKKARPGPKGSKD